MKNSLLIIIIIFISFLSLNAEPASDTIYISVIKDINLFCDYQFDSIIVLHRLNNNLQNQNYHIEITQKLKVASAEKILAYYIQISDSLSKIDYSINNTYLLSYLKWLVELTGEYVQQPILLDADVELADKKNITRHHHRLQRIMKYYYRENGIAMSLYFGLGANNSNGEFGRGTKTGGKFELGMGAEKSKIALELAIHYQVSFLDNGYIWNIPYIPDSLALMDQDKASNLSINLLCSYNIHKHNKVKISNSIGYTWGIVDIHHYHIESFKVNNIIFGLRFNYLLGHQSGLHKSSELFGLIKSENIIKYRTYWYIHFYVEPYDYDTHNLGSGIRYSITTGLKLNIK